MSSVRQLRMASKLLKKQRQEIRRFECERKIQFIEVVKNKNALWDRRLQDHRNRELLDALWMEVATETGQSKDEARKLWKSLVDQFRNVYFSLTLKHGDFIGESQIEKVRWAYFVPLLFLKDVIGKRESSWNFQVDIHPDAEEIFAHKDNGIEDDAEYSVEATSPADAATMIETTIIPRQIDVSMSPQSNVSSIASAYESLYQRRKEGQSSGAGTSHGSAEPKKKKVSNEILLADENILTGILRRERDVRMVENPGRDSSTVFGEYVASLLRRVPESERSNCEFRVIKILNEFIEGKH